MPTIGLICGTRFEDIKEPETVMGVNGRAHKAITGDKNGATETLIKIKDSDGDTVRINPRHITFVA